MKPVLFGAVAATALFTASAGFAQTVDYTNAEEMFGEPVTVSVTGKPQRASEAPANITILSADDIRRSGASDIPSALRFVPGLDVRRYGQFQASVGIRGYNTAFNPRVLVLVDGRQVYNDDYGNTIWSLIPVTMAEIRQIEIIRGPNAALYGFNAVSGVINIVTFDPLRDRKTNVSAVGGTQGTIYGEGVATLQPSDRVGVRVSAKGRQTDELDGTAGQPVLVARPQARTGAVDLRARLSDDLQLNLSASRGRLEADQYIDIGAYFASGLENGSLRATLTANTPIGLAELDAYHNQVDQRFDVQELSVDWEQAVTVVKASNLVRLGSDHTVRLGGEYRHNSIVSDLHYGGEMTSDLVAGSASWNWQIRPNLSLTNAARLDAVEFSRNGAGLFFPGIGHPFGDRRMVEPSYNSMLLYAPTDYDTFRVGTGRALQLPSLFSYGFQGNSGPLNVLGSRFLDPSAVTNHEIGYQRRLPDLGSTLGLSIFHQETDTTIGSPFGSGFTITPNRTAYLTARNFGGSRATGGEITLEGNSATGWRWNLAYALAMLDDASPASQLHQAPSVAYEMQTPTHSVTAGLGLTWRDLELDAAAKWQSGFSDFRANRTTRRFDIFEVPDYLTVTARAGYRLGEAATLSLTAEQLNATRLTVSAGRQTERRVLAGLKLDF